MHTMSAMGQKQTFTDLHGSTFRRHNWTDEFMG
jgi:hypothetical protein